MDKVWLKSYKSGIPEFINLDETSITDMFAKACINHANNRAITCHKVNLTYAQVYARVMKIAEGLKQLGVVKGDRVGLILPNSLQYPLSVFAVLALGAIVVNVNPLYTADEIEYLAQDARPKVIITLDMFAEKLNSFHNKHGIEHIVVSKFADPYPLFKRLVIGLVLRYVSKVNPKLEYTPVDWGSLFNHSEHLVQVVKSSANDIAFIQYTGATTGRPKGAILLHRNLVSNIRQVTKWIDVQVPNPDRQIIICALPLYHIFSLTANLLTFFMYGAENVMIPNAKDINDMVKTMNNTPFTIFNSLDTLYHKLLENKSFVETPHPTYKYGICGGMATRKTVAEAWNQLTGHTPTNCYGLTETSPCVTMSFFDEGFSGSVGYPVPSTELDIRDLATLQQSLDVNQEGVIFIRGPQVMPGYWQNPEQTANVLSVDGWLNTGDIGYINDKGQLFISGRQTEMIKVSGFNVYPAEIERVIDELPEVYEVAVVGCANDRTGEDVHAFIVLAAGKSITKEVVIEHCAKSLTKYKIPRTVTFVAELPKTLVGKVDKKQIVATYLKPKT